MQFRVSLSILVSGVLASACSAGVTGSGASEYDPADVDADVATAGNGGHAGSDAGSDAGAGSGGHVATDAAPARDTAGDSIAKADAGAPDVWTDEPPDPNLKGPEVLIAVGGGGGRAVSLDMGLTWKSIVPTPNAIEIGEETGKFFEVAYAHGAFIAVAGGPGVAHVARTTDGKTWTDDQRIGNRCSGIAYGNGMWLISAGEFWKSYDGVNWEKAKFPLPQYAYGRIELMTFANGMFVGVGAGGWWVSTPDGKTWNYGYPKTEKPKYLTDVAFGNGTWVAVGVNHLVSTDNAKTWTEYPFSAGFRITHDGKQFIANTGGQKSLAFSPDGITWTKKETNVYHYGGIRYLNGVYFDAYLTTPMRSTDAIHWQSMTLPLPAFGIEDFRFGKLLK